MNLWKHSTFSLNGWIMVGSDVVREVSLDLNDQEAGFEFTRWTRDQLASYLREALSWVSQYRKDLFLNTLTVEVEPGGDWQKACSCSSILRIYGEVDKNGKLIRFLRRVNDVEADIWPGDIQRCTVDNGSYKMESYSISATEPSMFRVYPPVPENKKRYVSVVCYEIPSGSLDADYPDEVVALVKLWMLYRALSVDSENNSDIFNLAEKYKETFFGMLKSLHALGLEDEARYGSVRATQEQTNK